jgi:AraC-like DNA-binding protein
MYRGERNQEYYLGHYAIEAASTIDVRAERHIVGSMSVIRLRSRNRLWFRRSWNHIQQDGTDVGVLWLVKRGSLIISCSGGRSIADPGDFAVTHSLTPFLVECRTDSQRLHEVLHVVVPTAVLRSFVRAPVATGFRTAMDSTEFSIAERILQDVLEDEGRLSERSSKLMIDSALSLLCDAAAGRQTAQPASRSVADQHLDEALRFIEIHLLEPGLTPKGVAEACGISTRYLAFLLARQGATFSGIIWQRRLAAAKDWISNDSSVPIRKIAYRVGFKSAAHFSRRFKQEFNVSPEQYRVCCSASRPEPSEPGEKLCERSRDRQHDSGRPPVQEL